MGQVTALTFVILVIGLRRNVHEVEVQQDWTERTAPRKPGVSSLGSPWNAGPASDRDARLYTVKLLGREQAPRDK